MAKINEYPLERFTFGDDDYYDIDYWDGAVYQSAKIKGSTIKAAMSGGGSILAADGQVMPADRSQDLANFKLSLRDGVFTLGTVDADFGSIFQATKDSGNTYATIKTKTNDNAALILDINTADVTGAGNKTAFIQFRDAGVSKYIFGTNTDGVASFSDNSFFISSSSMLTDYIQAIDRDTESFVIGRQVGNPLNDNTKFLINNGNSFDTTELNNVLMLSSRDESKKWSVDKDMFFSATKIKGDSTSGTDSQLLLQDSTGVDLWDFRNNGDVYLGKNTTIFAPAEDIKIDTSGGYTNTPFMVESYPLGGSGMKPYFKVKGYGEVEILARTTNLFTVKDSAGSTVLDVNSGDVNINGGSSITSTFFQVKTTSGSMDFYNSSGGSLVHSIQTSLGFPDKVRFNILGGTRQFIVGGSSVIGTENISLQSDTLIGNTGNSVGFYGVTPTARATTGISGATFVANTGTNVHETSTFGGYTIGQVVQALQNLGILT